MRKLQAYLDEQKEQARYSSNIITGVFALLGVLIGFLLNRIYEWWKERKRIYNMIEALYEELNDTSRWLERIMRTQRKALKLLFHKEKPDFMPNQIPMNIYNKYYSEVLVHISDPERLSFNSIYSLIGTVNNAHITVGKMLSESNIDTDRLKEACNLLEGAFANAMHAMGLANFHILHQKRFRHGHIKTRSYTMKYLDTSQLTEDTARQLDADIKDEIHKLMEEARNTKVEDIKKEVG